MMRENSPRLAICTNTQSNVEVHEAALGPPFQWNGVAVGK
jgi:hypothetical protein